MQLWTVNYSEAPYNDCMFSLKTEVTAPHPPGEWNRMFRAAWTLQKISTLIQVYSCATGEIQLPKPYPVVSANPHQVWGCATSFPQGKEPVCYWWEHELWRGWREGEVCADSELVDAWGVPGDAGCRCFPRAAQGIHPDLQEFTAWQCLELSKQTQVNKVVSLLSFKEKREQPLSSRTGSTPQAHEFQLCGFQWPEIQALTDTMWLFRTDMLHLTTKICF